MVIPVDMSIAPCTGESGWAGRFDLLRRDNIAAIQRANFTDEMQHSHLLPSSPGLPLPERFLSRLVGFADLFTRPTWSNVLVLLAGAILAPGRRTVSAVLRILGRECDRNLYLSPYPQPRGVVIPGRGAPAAYCAGKGLRAVRRPSRDRPRRHHRTALGRQDQRSRHLSRSVCC